MTRIWHYSELRSKDPGEQLKAQPYLSIAFDKSSLWDSSRDNKDLLSHGYSLEDVTTCVVLRISVLL